jgi:hypothetical protein
MEEISFGCGLAIGLDVACRIFGSAPRLSDFWCKAVRNGWGADAAELSSPRADNSRSVAAITVSCRTEGRKQLPSMDALRGAGSDISESSREDARKMAAAADEGFAACVNALAKYRSSCIQNKRQRLKGCKRLNVQKRANNIFFCTPLLLQKDLLDAWIGQICFRQCVVRCGSLWCKDMARRKGS